MEFTIVISIIALLISIGSFGVTLWATRISRRSLDHAIRVQETNEEKEFERIRTGLLMQISDSRRILEKTRIEIGTIKANFDAESQPVQVLMTNYTKLFTEYLPGVESNIKQLDALWRDVSGWTDEKDYKKLMEAKATLYHSSKDDEQVYESAIFCVKEFKTKLELAKQHVNNGLR